MEWKDGYPKPNGASDWDDSSHLAGILVLTDHPQAPDMRQYVFGDKYKRNPWTERDCSGDQGILIMCALLKQGHNDLVRTSYIDGKDWIRPSTHGIEAIAKGQKPSWLQYNWFVNELKFNGKSTDEPFQNMGKSIAYGKFKLWTEINTKWDTAILDYLRAGENRWRGEKDLAEHCIEWGLRELTK